MKKRMLSVCPECNLERWVDEYFYRHQNKPGLCHSCWSEGNRGKVTFNRRENNPRWKGGRSRVMGYFKIRLAVEDFFYPMVMKDGYVLEHRLVMANHLGRCLHSWEIVHHKNHIRDDNRIENLQLVSDDRHKQITILEVKIDKLDGLVGDLQKRITILEAENIMLRRELINETQYV